MEALIKWLLTAEGISVSGVLLAGIVALGYLLAKKKWVPGWVYDVAIKERDEYKAALELRNAQDRERDQRLQEKADAMEKQITELTAALIKRQARRSRPRGSL